MGIQSTNGYTDYFGNFLQSYPTPEHRLAAAAKLMVGQADDLLEQFPSRIQLVARWAENNAALHQKARELYEARYIARRYTGQLALSFVQGGREAINLEDGWMEDQVVVQIGRVSDGDLVHQAARRRSTNTEARLLLAHHMGLAVSGPVIEVEADVVGAPAAQLKPAADMLPIWDGLSPITTDQSAYEKFAREQQHQLVLGTAPVLATLREIESVTERGGLIDWVRDNVAA